MASDRRPDGGSDRSAGPEGHVVMSRRIDMLLDGAEGLLACIAQGVGVSCRFLSWTTVRGRPSANLGQTLNGWSKVLCQSAT